MSDGDGIRVVASTTPMLRVQLSREESWQLYVLLADDAPFVRHDLRVTHHGGTGAVSLSTPHERRQVLDALDAAASGGPLTTGLDALKTALRAGV
jgi:hypothetical protein